MMIFYIPDEIRVVDDIECRVCKKTLPLDSFRKNANYLFGRTTTCKLCLNKKEKPAQRKYRITCNVLGQYRREILNNIKSERGCLVCRENHPKCLHFHHVDEKKYSISSLVTRKNCDRLITEIFKCIVLCANCHMRLNGFDVRIKTHPNFQFMELTQKEKDQLKIVPKDWLAKRLEEKDFFDWNIDKIPPF